MVDENSMTMDDFDQIIQDNPPGTIPDEPAQPAADASEAQQQQTETAQQTQEQNESNPVQTQTESETSDKHSANEAFAAMRVQNKKITDALAAVLQQHGLDPALARNPDQLIQDAENARLEEEAKKQKVPTELLQRLTQLEKANMENQQKRLADAALAGFQAVKTKYNLSTADISEFAKQLQDAGTNPFEQEMDLDKHYRLHNLDKIIEMETKKAVEEALRNQGAAAAHSTTPSKSQGKEATGVDDIDTMAKFDRFLMGL